MILPLLCLRAVRLTVNSRTAFTVNSRTLRISSNSHKCQLGFSDIKTVEVSTSLLLYRSQMDLNNRIFNVGHFCNFNLTPAQYLNLVRHSYYLLSGIPSFIDGKSDIITAFQKMGGREPRGNSLATLFGNIYWMYQTFPDNFTKVLDVFRVLNQKQDFYEKKILFERMFSEPEFTEIYSAYKMYWLKKSDEGSIRVNFSLFKKDQTLLEERQFIRVYELKNTKKISYSKLRELNEKGSLDIIGLSTRKQLINKRSVNILLKEREQFITRKEAGFILGIPAWTVPSLVRAGVLRKEKGHTFKSEKYIFKEVIELMNCCRGKLTVEKPEGLTFQQVLDFYSKDGLNIVLIIEQTLNNKLKPRSVLDSGTLKDNFYRVSEVQQCMELIRSTKS